MLTIPGQRKMNRLNKILLIVLISLAVLILTVSITAFAVKKADPGTDLRNSDPAPTEIESLNKKTGDKQAAYTGLGTIRTITAMDPEIEGDLGTVTVITPWLSYPEGDSVFFEELARKRLVITGVITNYFSNRTKALLLSMPEEKIKEELKELINAQLSLGKISAIYFTDYIFLE